MNEKFDIENKKPHLFTYDIFRIKLLPMLHSQLFLNMRSQLFP